MSVNPTPLRMVRSLTSEDVYSGNPADDVGVPKCQESAFGSDGMLTGRAGPCHAVPGPRGYALITKLKGACDRAREG
jgi:hypothetical protein